MFLTNLVEQNAAFARTVIDLHQAGDLPPDTYVIDLDTLAENARLICDEAHRLGLQVVAMSKHIGRNPDALRALRSNGVDSFVAVDLACARAIDRASQPLGHVGHLTQIPRAAAAEIAGMAPEHWSVFSPEKAREAAAAARRVGRVQGLLARIFSDGDTVLPSRAGGFDAAHVLSVADDLDAAAGGRFSGITTYPALSFDRQRHQVVATANLRTLERAAALLASHGRTDVAVNAPGETSTTVLRMLAGAGATHVEPGHGFTGTGALHGVAALPERPAMLYLSEVSHLAGDTAYCFGGGLYLCSGSIDYQPTAIVGRDLEHALTQRVPAELSRKHQLMDFYGLLHPRPGDTLHTGDSVIFSFRAQAFYTRSMVVGISGISTRAPRLHALHTTDGRVA